MDIAGLIEVVKKITIRDTDSLVKEFKNSSKENLSISQKSKIVVFLFLGSGKTAIFSYNEKSANLTQNKKQAFSLT